MATNTPPLIIGNWKMNGDKTVWQKLATSLTASLPVNLAQNASDVTPQADIVICPPLAALGVIAETLEAQDCSRNTENNDTQNKQIKLGAQNLYPGADAAVTGEVNAGMLKSMGCGYVIVGHSERRALFSESDGFVAQKTRSALEAGLVPVVCIGERADTPDPDAFLEQQLKNSLQGVDSSKLKADMGNNLIIAYEPIWAVGTGKTATPETIAKTTTHLRKTLRKLYGADVGDGIRILYGGSMKAENAAKIMAVPNVSGGLVGGASLKVDAFTSLAKNACL